MADFPHEFWVTAGTAAPVLLAGLIANSLVVRLKKHGVVTVAITLIAVSVAGGAEVVVLFVSLRSLAEAHNVWPTTRIVAILLLPLFAIPIQAASLIFSKPQPEPGAPKPQT